VVVTKVVNHKIFVKHRNIGKIIGIKTMTRSGSYHERLIQNFKDPLEAAAYIEVVLEEGYPKMLSKALKNIIEAQGGIKKLSTEVQKSCYQLEKILVEQGKIEFYGLSTLLDNLGLQLAIRVKSI
jgi:DNA-binding phage protein